MSVVLIELITATNDEGYEAVHIHCSRCGHRISTLPLELPIIPEEMDDAARYASEHKCPGTE